MRRAPEAVRRPIPSATYAVFFLLFALILFLVHAPFVRLPYFWDEAGHYAPAALDLYESGAWIPHSAQPDAHPPAVPAYVASFWRLAGPGVVNARIAMLLLSALGLLAAFLLAIELCRDVLGTPAFLAIGLLIASPPFLAQSMLVQLDAPAMVFTSLALLMFLQDRIWLCVAACCALVMTKETGAVAPLVFGVWLACERRWRDAALFAAPLLVLVGWLLTVRAATGSIFGTDGFAQYNLFYPLHPVRIVAALVRRAWSLFVADAHWLGTIAIVWAALGGQIFRTRSWRVAWTLLAAHSIAVSILGGAVLVRYLIPVLPILYTAMVAGLSLFRPWNRQALAVALLAAMTGAHFVNPPFPFAYEENLAFTDFLRLHQQAAEFLERDLPARRITTAWPMTQELSRPELGFVTLRLPVDPLADFSRGTLQRTDWSGVEVAVIYSREWDPEPNLIRWEPMAAFWQMFNGYEPQVTREEARERIPIPRIAHFERRGQWIDVYAR
jgi:hypothetical protein